MTVVLPAVRNGAALRRNVVRSAASVDAKVAFIGCRHCARARASAIQEPITALVNGVISSTRTALELGAPLASVPAGFVLLQEGQHIAHKWQRSDLSRWYVYQ